MLHRTANVQIEQDAVAAHLPSYFTGGTLVLEEVIRRNSLQQPFNKKLLVLTCRATDCAVWLPACDL